MLPHGWELVNHFRMEEHNCSGLKSIHSKHSTKTKTNIQNTNKSTQFGYHPTKETNTNFRY